MQEEHRTRVGHCREMARKVLQKHGISAPPVDVEAILGAEGYAVKRRDWPSSVSGICLREAKIVGVNRNHALVRQRFTLGHEYGHLILGHRDDSERVSLSTIDQEPQIIPHSKIEDDEADEFAGELLAPLQFIKGDWTKCQVQCF